MGSHKRMDMQWPNLVAGIAGGAASTLALHPLDLAKVRLQVNEGTGVIAYRPNTKGFIKTLKDVVHSRGWKGLYQGLTPNLIGASGSWGLYFLLYAKLKSQLQAGDPTRTLSTLAYLGTAAAAGAITLTVMNPIWVVKTRLCLQYESQSSVTSSAQSRSKPHFKLGRTFGPQSATTCGTLLNLWRHEGFPGLYRGYIAGLFGVSHGAIQFMLYEQLRNWYNEEYWGRPSNTKLVPFEYIVFASMSKLGAVSITYPYQVIRSRMQDQHRQYTGIIHLIRELWNCEGIYGFYKGLVPNLIRVTPACAITFVVYEYTVDFLRKID